MKRHRSSSSSDSSDNESERAPLVTSSSAPSAFEYLSLPNSPSTSFCSSSKYGGKAGTPISVPKKPAEVFRKDLISAMKLPDSHHISLEEYYLLADPWRQEWEKGVQVPASPDAIPQASVRIVAEEPKENLFSRPKKYIQCCSQEPQEPGCISVQELAEAMCRYDLDDMDLYWLQELNQELAEMGEDKLDELTMERVMEALERQCHDCMNHAIETEEGLGIEYDEDVVCDVCRSPESEEGNDMVFCDKCNICVHQACYGIVKVPDGCWLCRTCVLGIDPQCMLCPNKGGAMKATRAGTKWAHVSCALWIPEVSIACPERMEPITKVSHIPPSRWSLICSLCKLKMGACIQCSVKSCTVPFHVTCAFEHNLDMKTILDEGDEVKFKSYCLKHSKPKAGEGGLSPARQKPPTETEKLGLRARKLQELEEEFYSLVHPGELAQNMTLPPHILDFIFQYWKLKRKSSFNKALLPPKEEEENVLLRPEENSVHTRMRMFMHLRQDLERVRNLCYMVSRREKLKLSHSKAQEQVFNLQVQLMDEELCVGTSLPRSLEKTNSTPPRIMLKLKMPKEALGNGKSSFRSGNIPLCPDNGRDVFDGSSGKVGQVKGRDQTPHLTNGLLPVPVAKPPGKTLGHHSIIHGHSSNGHSKQERVHRRLHKFSSVMEDLAMKGSLRSPYEHGSRDGTSGKEYLPDGLGHFTVEQSSRQLKEGMTEATNDRGAAAWNTSTKDPGTPCQESDGYCPDLELSDSEPEIKGRKRRVRGLGYGLEEEYPDQDCGKGSSRSKLLLGSRTSVQRS